jgi:hypothetical protein
MSRFCFIIARAKSESPLPVEDMEMPRMSCGERSGEGASHTQAMGFRRPLTPTLSPKKTYNSNLSGAGRGRAAFWLPWINRTRHLQSQAATAHHTTTRYHAPH